MRKLLAIITATAMLFGFAASANCVIEPVNDNTVMVYGTISLHDGLKLRQLTQGDQTEWKLVINSGGGNAIQMADLVYRLEELKRNGDKIITEVTGIAGSAAAVMWLMGDERIAHDYSMVMFHKAFQADRYGNKIPEEQLSEEDRWVLRHFNKVIESRLDSVVGVEMRKKLLTDENVWFNGKQLYDLGIATKLLP